MAFVPDYEHDVFISYCQRDNVNMRFGGDESIEWVTEFKDSLEERIRSKLGSPIKLWMDTTNMRGNEKLDKGLVNNVKSSAVFIAILSQEYVKSNDGIPHELDVFLQCPGSNDRIFVVKLDPYEMPPPLQEAVRYEFYDKLTTEQEQFAPFSPAYCKSLVRLTNELCGKLKTLKEERASKTISSSQPHPSRPKEGEEKKEIIFLSEGTNDLEDARNSIKDYLNQEGYTVLPDKHYIRRAKEYEQSLTQDLDRAILFVQFLGGNSTPIEDFPEGLERLQLTSAKAANLPILRGCSKETYRDRNQIPDPAHREFLNAEDIRAEDLEDFKSAIKNEIEQLRRKKQDQDRFSDQSKPIFIYSRKSDVSTATDIKTLLEGESLGLCDFFYFEEKERLQDISKEYIPTGLVFIHGASTEDTEIVDKVKLIRNLKVQKRINEPACAICFHPPETRSEMLVGIIPDYFIQFFFNNNDNVSKFIEAFKRKLHNQV